MIDASTRRRLYLKQAAWFDRMGNLPGATASRLAAQRIAPGERDIIRLPSVATVGRMGGIARAARLSPERRAEIASNAAKTRWRKRD